MPIYHNGQQITAVYAGSTNVTDLYAGSSNVALGGGSPTPTDPYFSNVVLLIQDGMSDLSNSAHTTSATNVSINYTTVPVSGMASSIQFPGSGNLLRVFDSPALTLPGDFTMEGWIYHDSTNGQNYPNVFCIGAYSAADSFGIEHENYLSPIAYGRYHSSNWSYANFFTSGDNKWNYFCYERSGTNVAISMNGSISMTVSGSTISFNNSSTTGLIFGQLPGFTTASNWKGFMAGLRLTKGVARYGAANFTVPTAPHPTS